MKTFKLYLTELFDKPWKMEHDPEMESLVRDHYNNHPNYKDHKYGAVKAFKLEGNNGHLIHVVRKGFHEIHHIGSDYSSGENEPRKTKANPKFVGTAFHYAKEHVLSKGKQVKISASDSMYSSIQPIVHRLAKKHGYEVQDGEETIGEHHYKHTIVRIKGVRAPSLPGLSEWLNNNGV